jgi:MATE family multidrug resistance protein
MSRVTTEFRELLKLALPLAAAQAGSQLMGLVDTAIVGRVGAVELAAVGLGNALFFSFAILGMGIVMGIDPLTSQAFGAGDRVAARRSLWQGVWLALAVSIVLGIASAASPWLARLLEIDARVTKEATAYVLIRAWSLPPLLVFMVCRSYLQAAAVTRPIVVGMVIGNIFNFFGDLLFVFGGSSLPAWTGPLRLVPAMGVAGAALVTVAGMFIQLWIVVAAVKAVPVNLEGARIHRPVKREMLTAFRIGLPVGLHMGAEYGVFALVSMIAGRLGAEQLAAHQLAIILASLSFTIAVGIGSAGGVRVGYAIGAGDRHQTRLAGLVAFGGGAIIMTTSALLFILFPRQLASVISNQQDVIATALPLLFVAAAFQISDGIQGVGAGVLRGAGDTHYTFVANMVGHWLIGLPIAWYLGFYLGGGVVGLWWGLSVGLTVVAVLLLLRFIRRSAGVIAPIASHVRPLAAEENH